MSAQVTAMGIRDGDPAVLKALVNRRGSAVLAYCERACAPSLALDAAAEAFWRFRATVLAVSRPGDLDPESALLGATRHAAAARTPRPPARGGATGLGRLLGGRTATDRLPEMPDLVIARLDGTITPEDRAALEEMLGASPVARGIEERFTASETAYASAPRQALPGAIVEQIVAAMGALTAPAPPTAPPPAANGVPAAAPAIPRFFRDPGEVDPPVPPPLLADEPEPSPPAAAIEDEPEPPPPAAAIEAEPEPPPPAAAIEAEPEPPPVELAADDDEPPPSEDTADEVPPPAVPAAEEEPLAFEDVADEEEPPPFEDVVDEEEPPAEQVSVDDAVPDSAEIAATRGADEASPDATVEWSVPADELGGEPALEHEIAAARLHEDDHDEDPAHLQSASGALPLEDVPTSSTDPTEAQPTPPPPPPAAGPPAPHEHHHLPTVPRAALAPAAAVVTIAAIGALVASGIFGGNDESPPLDTGIVPERALQAVPEGETATIVEDLRSAAADARRRRLADQRQGLTSGEVAPAPIEEEEPAAEEDDPVPAPADEPEADAPADAPADEEPADEVGEADPAGATPEAGTGEDAEPTP